MNCKDLDVAICRLYYLLLFSGMVMRKFCASILALVTALLVVGTGSSQATEADSSGIISRTIDHLAVGQVKTVDLSHVLNSTSPDFFGRDDVYKFRHSTEFRDDGYGTGTFQTPEHFGTHIDAPVHFVAGASPIDKIPVEHLILPAVVIDARKEVENNPNFALTVPLIQEWEKKNGRIPNHAAILLLSGWSRYWNSEKQYRNPDSSQHMHFPGYSAEAATFLIEERKANAIGVDTLSIDPGESKTYPVHKIAGSHNVYIIENLNNLDQLPAKGILLFCGCLALEGGTGCPSRIIALVDATQ